MSLFKKKKAGAISEEEIRTKDFFDCILPGNIRFFAKYYVVGDSYCDDVSDTF